MNNSLDLLKTHTAKIQSLPDPEWAAFAAIWHPGEAKRKTVLTRPGEVEKYLYFITEGAQRIYFSDEAGREATLLFTYAGTFGGVLDSCLLQMPSRYFYESLTPSMFLKATIGDLNQCMTQYPLLESLVRKGTTLSLSGILERTVELQCYTAEERFKVLLKRSPHILQLIPHKYLANYLGMDPTNFSKFMNKVRS